MVSGGVSRRPPLPTPLAKGEPPQILFTAPKAAVVLSYYYGYCYDCDYICAGSYCDWRYGATRKGDKMPLNDDCYWL